MSSKQQLTRAIQALDQVDQHVVNLSFIELCTPLEIALILNKTLNSIEHTAETVQKRIDAILTTLEPHLRNVRV